MTTHVNIMGLIYLNFGIGFLGVLLLEILYFGLRSYAYVLNDLR